MKNRIYITLFTLVLAVVAFATNDPKLSQNYPNPATNKTYVDIEFSSPEATLTLYNVLGKKMDVMKLNQSGKFIIDVSELPEGIYLYTLDADGEKITKRMTVKK